jgi:hypothetical protein
MNICGSSAGGVDRSSSEGNAVQTVFSGGRDTRQPNRGSGMKADFLPRAWPA